MPRPLIILDALLEFTLIAVNQAIVLKFSCSGNVLLLSKGVHFSANKKLKYLLSG